MKTSKKYVQLHRVSAAHEYSPHPVAVVSATLTLSRIYYLQLSDVVRLKVCQCAAVVDEDEPGAVVGGGLV